MLRAEYISCLWIHQWQCEVFVLFESTIKIMAGRHKRDVELSKIDGFINLEIECAAQ